MYEPRLAGRVRNRWAPTRQAGREAKRADARGCAGRGEDQAAVGSGRRFVLPCRGPTLCDRKYPAACVRSRKRPGETKRCGCAAAGAGRGQTDRARIPNPRPGAHRQTLKTRSAHLTGSVRRRAVRARRGPDGLGGNTCRTDARSALPEPAQAHPGAR